MSDWLSVAKENEIQPGQAKLVDADDVYIAIYNIDGELFALEDTCSHDNVPILACGLPLNEIIDGDQIICPRHGARFEIKTGKALTPPAFEDVASFPIRVLDGMIQVRDDRWDD